MDAWKPETRFLRRKVFLLGNGPSLNQKNVDKLYYRHADTTIAMNDSMILAPWAGYLFFRDNDWFEKNRVSILDWENEIITTDRLSAQLMHTIRYVKMEHVKGFMKVGAGSIKYGRTSGHRALSLTVTMGAEYVFLLGFDCRAVDGISHWNRNAVQVSNVVYEKDFLQYWKGWGELAESAGVKVVNCTPDSAIKEFPFQPLDEIL